MADPQEVLIDIRERLVRVEVLLNNQNDLRGKVENVETKATETEARSKSNTHRIDKLEEANRWLWRTLTSALIASIISVALAILK